MAIYLRNLPNLVLLQPNNHPLKTLIRSPRYATLYAILATISATVSYTFFHISGRAGCNTSGIVIATIILSTLLAIHIPLVLNAPVIRNHPWVRTHNPTPLQSTAVFLLSQYLAVFLAAGADLYSVVSAAAHVVDVFFILLCLLPGWRKKDGILTPSMAVLALAMGRAKEVGWVWYPVAVVGFYLVFYVYDWIHSEAPVLIGLVPNEEGVN